MPRGREESRHDESDSEINTNTQIINTVTSRVKVKTVKISLLQALEAHKVARG
jgi:hypothetical protein